MKVYIENENIIKQLQTEFEYQDRSGLYAKLQKEMAYNSNKIEGSRLTEKHTASLFETGTIVSDGVEVYVSKDIEEMNGHFLMFNEMVKTISSPLTEALIKRFHFCLKNGVFEDIANGRPIGEYKNRANTVANIITSPVSDVHKNMEQLLSDFKEIKSLEDVALFHARFENIHPFQDGNGRVGRMIILKQCLENDLPLVIINDADKMLYYKALSDYSEKSDISSLSEFFKEQSEKLLLKIEPFFKTIPRINNSAKIVYASDFYPLLQNKKEFVQNTEFALQGNTIEVSNPSGTICIDFDKREEIFKPLLDKNGQQLPINTDLKEDMETVRTKLADYCKEKDIAPFRYLDLKKITKDKNKSQG